MLRLLPFSLAERREINRSDSLDDLLYSGFYPRVHGHGLVPRQAYADYFETDVERDLRQAGQVRNLSNFRRFVRLCAGRVGQLINLSSLGADAGVSHVTAQQWLTLLDTSYIAFRLPTFRANIRKRLVKAPKLYFYDVGLASHLIGIKHSGQIATHPLPGPLFENMIEVECLKHRFNRGRTSDPSFYRDGHGLGCDLLFEAPNESVAIEIKSGATIAGDFFSALHRVANVIATTSRKFVVYGGT